MSTPVGTLPAGQPVFSSNDTFGVKVGKSIFYLLAAGSAAYGLYLGRINSSVKHGALGLLGATISLVAGYIFGWATRASDAQAEPSEPQFGKGIVEINMGSIPEIPVKISAEDGIKLFPQLTSYDQLKSVLQKTPCQIVITDSSLTPLNARNLLNEFDRRLIPGSTNGLSDYYSMQNENRQNTQSEDSVTATYYQIMYRTNNDEDSFPVSFSVTRNDKQYTLLTISLDDDNMPNTKMCVCVHKGYVA